MAIDSTKTICHIDSYAGSVFRWYATEVVVARHCRTTEALHNDLGIVGLLLNVVHILRIYHRKLLHSPHRITILCPLHTPSFLPASYLNYNLSATLFTHKLFWAI